MAERGVFVDHSTLHCWSIKVLAVLAVLAAMFRRRIKCFRCARSLIAGIGVMQMVRKGQLGAIADRAPSAANQFYSRASGSVSASPQCSASSHYCNRALEGATLGEHIISSALERSLASHRKPAADFPARRATERAKYGTSFGRRSPLMLLVHPIRTKSSRP